MGATGQTAYTPPAAGDHKRYCSESCGQAHAARDARTAAVYLRIPAIATATQTDADLLRMVLELDACRADGDVSASGADIGAWCHMPACRRPLSLLTSPQVALEKLQPTMYPEDSCCSGSA